MSKSPTSPESQVSQSSSEFPPAYDPKVIDSKWYHFWEKNQLFSADPSSPKPKYSIVMPPPNVTGVLHMGHALVNTLQDILIRWKRMLGFETLWVPGTDHAGISTQTVVERHLMKTMGKKRVEFSREEFLKHVWKWKEESEAIILQQIKRLGCSCDWTRQRFTMDEGNNQAVRTIFKKLYDDQLIYLGDYLVNWDPVTQTAISDDEVEYEERSSFLWHFKYPFKDGSGFAVIATTRPETMLGDTAVAVSPNDERYSHLIGKLLHLPLVDREIPIIADHRVDPLFGTGMVKVTPAHDPNDYQMGLDANLPFINILTPDGKINENGKAFKGMTIEEARKAVVQAMKDRGFLEKVEPHIHRVGVSYRSKAVIEPYMSKQWFVRMGEFAKRLDAAVRTGQVAIIPKAWESVYYHWTNNLRDWCISRQLWWGHRIPIWHNKKDPNKMICYAGEGNPPEVEAAPDEWRQEDDVLDTWFSSALWPFSTLGWPDHTSELQAFYPNSVLVTGHDILFFWVARMICMGEYAMGKPPFPEVFLHGLIYGKSYWRNNPGGGITYVNDQERLEYDMGKAPPSEVQSRWEKMSKTKGNVIDPLEIIDQYGTDAMRMALCASATQAREIDLDRRKFEEFKNFANKIWNGARFIFMNLESDATGQLPALSAKEFSKGLDESKFSLEDRWILSSLNHTIKKVQTHLESYLFDQSALEAYDFFWKEFCAYYLEIAKPILFGKVGKPEDRLNKQKLLVIVLSNALRLLHPMAPFITEELFQRLKNRLPEMEANENVDPYTRETVRALASQSCMVAPFPKVIRASDINLEIEQTFDLVDAVVYALRNIRGEMKLPPGTSTDVHIVGHASDTQFQMIQNNVNIISALVRTGTINCHQEEPKIGMCCTGLVNSMRIMVPIPEEWIEKEKARLNKEKDRLDKVVQKFRQQLSNPEFIEKAPEPLIEKQSGLLRQAEKELEEVTNKLKTIAS